ncbi:hypothetical protein VF14_03405 [Nostoc linckia z18]|uniref:Uncharacterized protein n=2 Tax=Nostoc linckia TaxID=92942 RepID=A0A9Q6ENF6_NOSLI|nr:hypothetical protein [Nostoc linckia]PHK41429.1 hypothetical protein VF12_06385 [Nostoc linckia z15]PHK46930.1 hypothetical protein VF13_08045 [Nostoc linckia z16]PHJ69192.1 hypothetical protein VF02_00875 [Nostoc linckia z1]PHJ73343.1 hypothetical protein VF05_01890 [Nostoc linckia z3]PHJ78690.1 hypothetical protein VF03_00875 [Nostoc linckia z2]
MRRINRSFNERRLKKGGGGGSGGGSRSAKTRQKLNRTSTNTADKSAWANPPEGEKARAVFYQGKRVQGLVMKDGTVYWSIDGYNTATKESTAKVPTQELKDLKRAWNEYIKSPNAKRVFYADPSTSDGRGDARAKLYKSFGFRKVTDPKFGEILKLDNR